MRCCLLNVNLQSGGAERQLIHLVNYLQQKDFHIEVVLLERQGAWLDELPSGIPIHNVMERLPLSSPAKVLKALQSILRLRHFFRQQPCDIVLTFLWLPTVITALAFYGLNNHPLLVWSLQSDLVQDFRLHWDGWIRRWIVRTFLPKRVDHFIAISQGIKSRMQELLRLPDERFTFIPNSIDLGRITKMAERQDRVLPKCSAIRLVSVGRLHRSKDIDVLLRALSLLKKRGVNLEAYVIGDGPERERLMRLAVRLGLNGYVNFLGYARNPYAWLQTADIFISSSRWETFGISIIEAMALGIPVIATETDGACDIIRNSVDGLLVPIGDSQALANTVMELVQKPMLRGEISRQGRLRAEQFNARSVAECYMAILEKLIGHRENYA